MNADFTNLILPRIQAVVEIWHDVSDSCGSLCDLNTDFLGEIADVEATREDPRFFVQPRFVFQECTDPGSEICASSCTANGRCAPQLLLLPLPLLLPLLLLTPLPRLLPLPLSPRRWREASPAGG